MTQRHARCNCIGCRQPTDMTPGTQVLAPMRVVPVAYTPGVVIEPDAHSPKGFTYIKMPHKGRWLYQGFKRDQLIVIDRQYQSPLLA